MIDYERYKVNGELPLWASEFKRLQDILAPALEYDDTHNLQDIADCIDKSVMQLWPAHKSAVVTQVIDFPQKKVLHIFMAGGDLEDLNTLSPHIEKFAQHMGCQKITLTGRRGWSRTFLRNFNFKPTHYWLSAEV